MEHIINKKQEEKDRIEPIDKELKLKICFTLSILLSTSVMFHYALHKTYNFYQIAALVQLVLVVNFFCFFWIMFISSKKLYAIRIRRGKVADTRLLFVSEKLERNNEKAIESVSAMIGLQGSNLDKMACATIYPATAINVTAVIFHIVHQYKDKGNYNLADIAILIGAFGLWSLITWHLENTKKKQTYFIL